MEKISITPLTPKVADFLDWVDKDEWVKIINIIRRGIYYHRQSDLDYANDLLLPIMADYGIWDGENGVPIDEELCDELLYYIRIITEQPKVF